MPGLVSVVIPNYNRSADLALCIGSLLAQDYPDIEVIVVDDGSDDGAPDMVREKYPQVRLIANKVNRGFPAVVNDGIRAAKGEWVALLNNDAEADPRWVSELVDAAGRHPDASFFATKMLFHADRVTIDTFGDGFSTGGFGFKRGWGEPSSAYTNEAEVFGACAGAAMYRRSMLEDIREGDEYFDESFFSFAEDLDVSLRARMRGHKCIAVPGAVVLHKLRSAWGRETERVAYLSHRNFLLCVMKNFPASVILRCLLSMICYYKLSAWSDMLKNRRLLYAKAYMDALFAWPRYKAKRAAIQAGMRISPAEFKALLTSGWLPLWLRLGKMSRSVHDRGL